MANRIEGLIEMDRELGKLARKLPELVGSALYTEALKIELASRERTPVDTGALRASHETSVPEYGPGSVEVTISVGGPAAPYAAKVHELIEVHHRVGEAKFLEKSVNEAIPDLASNIAKRVDLEKAK